MSKSTPNDQTDHTPGSTEPRVVLHIGLHKTATTTLQVDIFPNLDAIQYLDIKTPAVRALIDQSVAQDPIYFDAQSAHSSLEKLFAGDRCNLISSEALSGPAWAGVSQRGIDHRSPVLQNLAATCPQAEVILIIRRQDNYAKSMYRQYVKTGGTASMSRFFAVDPQSGSPHPKAPMFARHRFQYLEYVQALQRYFPQGVHVLPFELLANTPDEFLRRLCAILACSPPSEALPQRNSSRLGSTGLFVSRILNRFFESPLNPSGILPGIPWRRHGKLQWLNPVELAQDRWPGTKGRQSETESRICAELLRSCADGNRQLAAHMDLDIESYGYF